MSYPASFYTNSHMVSPPPLSIMQYFYPYSSTDPTKSDPDGWVICDGLTRTVTDSRYAVIAPLLNTVLKVTTNTANSITPPNLTGKFLYGSLTPITVNETGGTTSTTLTSNHMPLHNHTVTEAAHTHTVTDAGHNHTITDPGHIHGGSVNFPNATYALADTIQSTYTRSKCNGIDTSITITTDSKKTGISLATATTGISLATATTGITVNNAGLATPSAVSTLPPYVTINYIMKY